MLIGKVGEGDPWTDAGILEGLPNLHLLGPKSYDELPAYMKGFDVALLPCALNDYTKGMFPMKFFEYLGAGVPVVSVCLDSLANHGDVAFFASDVEGFVTSIRQALAGDAPSLEERLKRAQEYTYESRTEKMLNLIEKGKV